ncbi:unnamed protein product [Linum tenue]|uniref:FBD domain-containing protein n=1 Tax=Linum tenue TaxID=586396 RepID=A0AAV0GS95_9ROSI|nr:unnamed protein product [Linum tenue]
MSLSGHTLSHLFAVDEYVRLPVFPKLTCLTIEMGGSSWVLHSLLSSVPNLQSLVIDLNRTARMMWESLEGACTPQCLLSSLEEIEVKQLVGFNDEKRIIAYFLKAGAVLKKVNMHVHHAFHQITSRKDLVSLLKPSRGSRACEACLFFPNGERVYSDSDDDQSNTDDDIDDDSSGSDDETDSSAVRRGFSLIWAKERKL